MNFILYEFYYFKHIKRKGYNCNNPTVLKKLKTIGIYK